MKLVTGMSVVELMIAMALGLWLLSGVFFCYLASQKNHQMEQALAHMQENGRIAIHLLSQNIHSAGYIGCLPLSSIALNQIELTNFNIATRVVGWHQRESTVDFQLPTEIIRNAIATSDILLVQSMVPDNNIIVSALNKTIRFSNKSPYKVGDILIISDCTHANIIKVTAVQSKSISVTPELSQPYNAIESEIGHLASLVYYIRQTNRKNILDQPIYALYKRDINAPATQAQEVVEGIENMQLKLGVKQGNNIKFIPIQQLTHHDWQDVVSVQIALLLDSIDPVTSRPLKYLFNGHVYSASDRLLRREWQTTITIREPIVLADHT